MQKTKTVIDLQAIRQNAAYFRRGTNARLCAVVKANAYGHGGAEVANALHTVADSFAVALIEEGVSLRLAGITKEILVLTPPLSAADVAQAAAFSLTLSVPDLRTASLVGKLPVHLQCNTGMNRYGADDIAPLLSSGLNVTGVYSHLYRAENPAIRNRQLALFSAVRERVKGVYPNACCHLAATGGFLAGEAFRFDWVRIGIGLYGYTPYGFQERFQPAMSVYARAVQSRVRKEGGMGYRSGNATEVTTLRYGYGDGFFRKGKLCMDACVTAGTVEGWVPIMTDAAETAREWNTIPYEVLCAVTKRTEYVYEN